MAPKEAQEQAPVFLAGARNLRTGGGQACARARPTMQSALLAVHCVRREGGRREGGSWLWDVMNGAFEAQPNPLGLLPVQLTGPVFSCSFRIIRT